MTCQPNTGPQNNQNAAAGRGQPITPCVSAAENESKPNPSPPRWYTALERSDWWIVIVAALTGFAIAYQANEMRKSTDVMREQRDSMQTQTRLSLRPFVGLDEGHDAIQTTPFFIDESGNARLTYIIRAKNYSDVPASNVWAAANLVVADDLNTVYEWQGYACDDAMIGKPDIGQILFPGRDRVFSSMVAMAKIIKKHEGSRLQVWLTGGIGYRDQFGYLYRTKFMFMLHDGAGHVTVFDPPKQPTQIVGRFVPMGGAIDAGQIPKYNYGVGPYEKKKPI
jgi:hypothetical protein